MGVIDEFRRSSRPSSIIKGRREQTILPDECQYGDNDLRYVES